MRDSSIDVLKFIAVVLVLNSHMDAIYPDSLKVLATGGGIGDALFFFCSGYCLSSKCGTSFLNWYKRRLRRIYSVVFSWALLCLFIFGKSAMCSVLCSNGGWFISCILVYYIFFWLLHQVQRKKLDSVLLATILIIVAVTAGLFIFTFVRKGNFSLFGGTEIIWLFYSIYMFLGSYIYRNREVLQRNASHMCSLFALVVSACSFYFFISFRNSPTYGPFQLLAIPLLALLVCSIYCLTKTSFLSKCLQIKLFSCVIRFIGGLCLEFFLVQGVVLRSGFLKDIPFPVNGLVVFFIVLVLAFFVHCTSKIWEQVFSNEDFEWRKVFDILY